MNKNMQILLGLTLTISAATSTADDIHASDGHSASDHTLAVSRVLPPELIKGPHFEVIDPVVNYFAHDQFIVTSDYGDYEVYGQMELRIRLREIQALGVLEKKTTGRVVADTLVRDVKKTGRSIAQVGAHPIQAGRQIGRGIKDRFKKLVRDVKEDVELVTSDAAGSEKAAIYAGRVFEVDKAYRRWAGELRVDPYTNNQLLVDELVRVATVEAGTDVGAKIVMPSIPGVGFMRDVYSLITTLDYRQLVEYNTKQLVALGAEERVITSFLNHPNYSPTVTSAMVGAIAAMDGVDNRLALLDQAMTSQSRQDSMFFMESTAMALWYHSNQVPLERFVALTGLPAAITQDGRVVVFAAVDFPHWSSELAELMREMQESYEDVSPRRELLLAGNAQRVFKEHIREMNWEVRIDLRDEYLEMLPWAVTNGEMLDR